jgi:glutathione S-transferase
VPALATDRGVISETPAILAFLAQSFPAAGLAPLDDPFEFARLQAFNSYLCSTVHVAHAHGRRGGRWSDDAAAIETMKAKVPQTMAACFELIETSMFAGPWVMGDAYTICDAYLYTIAGWLEADGVDPSRFPKVLDHRNRIAERPAVKAVLAVLKA